MADESPPPDNAEARRAALIRATLERRRSRGDRTAAGTGQRGGRTPVPKRASTGPAPVSFAQERLWFLEQLGEAESGYNIFLGLRLDGDLDTGALAGTLAEVVRRHESLRTRFEERDGQPIQVVQPPADRPLRRIDLSRVPAERRDAVLHRVAQRFRTQRLDLSRGPLFRSALADLGARRHTLLVVVHHAVFDGWSTGILLRELTALYRARLAGEPADLPELGIQYADFADWQRRWLTGEVLQEQLTFWRELLDGAPEELALPTDRPRPPVQTYRGAALRFHWPPELRSSLGELARRERGTLFMVLLAGWTVLLARYGGQPDLTVGTPIANRNRYELEPLIGLFANTLVLRADLRDRPSFPETVRRIREVALGAFSHQELPFERLVAELQPRRSLSHSPLFQVFFALQNVGLMAPDLPGVEAEPLRSDTVAARFDLDLTVVDDERGIGGRLVHNRDLFDATTARRMVQHLRALLQAALRHPDVPAVELPFLAASETHQVLREWSRSEAPSPEAPHLPAAFEAQVDRTPDAPAVVGDGVSSTYRELDRRANRIARRLLELGAGPGVPVAVLLGRSAELPAVLLGVLKAGAAYVPLDPAHPRERLALILEGARPALLVTESRHAGSASSWEGPALVLDSSEEAAALDDLDGGRPGLEIDPRNLAYVIFTSGSTGRPKGVAVPHAALVNFLVSMAREPGLSRDDVLVAVTTPSFDIAGLELFLPLIVGARVVVANRDTAADGHRLAALLSEQGATTLQATPATWQMLLESGWDGDSGLCALCGGEALPPGLAETLGPRVGRLWNLYGPTETTVWSALWRVDEPRADGTGRVPVGRAIAETTLHVVDSGPVPVPTGVGGELWIGGAGVARGYLGQPALTAERFVPPPFPEATGALPGSRAYRTGDLARFRSDGTLDVLGRMDHQVKIRGFRIEPGEIEAALAGHPRVAQAVVIAREDRPGDRRLVAYVVPRPPGVEVEELRRLARERLPDYMAPAAYVVMDRLPSTASGKVDRRALPAPEMGSDAAEAAPKDELERELAAIWSELLDIPVERIGVEDDFFALGGHSLLVTRMISRVEHTFGVRLEVRDVFKDSTLRGVKDVLLDTAERESGLQDVTRKAAPGPRVAPLSFAQERLWFLERFQESAGAYNISLGLHLEGDLDPAVLARALREIVRRHEPLRTRFEHTAGGPRQVVEPLARLRLTTIGLDRMGQAAGGPAHAETERLAALLWRRPFDLSRAPLLRAVLLRLGARKHALILTVHHAVSDGWSMGVLHHELTTAYRAFLAGLPAPLPEIPSPYTDFARWQREWLQGEELERQLAFWRRQLEGVPQELRLPTDRPYPPVQTSRGGLVAFPFEPSSWSALEALGRSQGATPFMALLALFSALLSRYSGQQDLAVGTPIANRTRKETEPLIGLFVNTLVLRCDLRDDPSFRGLVRRLREVALEAYAHQDLPFEKLVAELRPRRHLDRPPLFQVMLALQNAPARPPALPGVDVEPFRATSVPVRFELELVVGRKGEGVGANLLYNRDLFDPSTARRMAAHLGNLLAAATAAPDTAVSHLPLLGPAERHQLLLEVNDSAEEGDAGLGLGRCATPLHRWIEAQAARTPDRPAVVLGREILTYAETDARAKRLARRLTSLGIGPESRVAVAVERSPELIVALLAVLEAGGAYVPLDPSYPAERLAYMLADSGAGCLLVQGGLAEALPTPPAGMEVLDLEARPAPREGEPEGEAPGDAGPDALAYTIYTSGSTGRPKGVMNSHRGIANRLLWMQEAFPLGPDDRVLQKTPTSFDVSVWELFWPLMTGACLVLARPEGHKDAAYLARVLGDERITTLHFVPSMLQVFLGERDLSGLQALRRVITSGEALPRELADRFFQRLPGTVELHNLYGPTEAAVDVTWWPCRRGARRRGVPIGRPIANLRIHLVDSALRPVPQGVPGELVIGGVGLARGYLGRSALTAERFVPDALSGSAGAGGRLYRTGDLARRLPGGEVEFLGRIDHQVKVRGFRIELGEIEARLLEHPAVREAVVVAREDARGEPALAAYAVPAAGERPTVDALREHLRRALPEPMVPASFTLLEALPLNPSGKVDRGALPAPERPARAEGPEAAPHSGVEGTIAGIWRAVLARETVGLDDNFFDLGGHSLLLIEVQRRIHEELGHALDRALDVVELFRHPTIRSLARALGGQADEAAKRHAATAASGAADPAAALQRGEGSEIAIVGMAGRFPGAGDLDAYWRLLEAGREGIRTLTDDELRRAGLGEEDWSQPGYVRSRGVLEGAETFDAAFFGYSPREAEVMDPQQRAFLEAAWEALEHAGYDPHRAEGRIGVFGGAGMNTYLMNLLSHPEVIEALGAYQAAIANKHDTLPTRVSYKLGLVGPSVNVQTACSTSLVAVHVACRALLEGECDAALAGGVSISGTPTAGYRYQPGGIASPDGHCRAFDADGRGTVAGEGVGVVVLKRLADALAEGDTVHAVIRGTAINNDGSLKAGFTAPSVQGQAAAIARAHARAGVEPSSLGYVEAHGTGTELGDPIEIAALTQAFGDGAGSPAERGACLLGSVKTNLGHLDAAAGVAGLIKTVLVLKHGRVPPSLHFRRPNPKIRFDETPFTVAAELAAWPARQGPRRAGVSSFGIGGTNAHAVLEEAPPLPESGPSRPWQLLVLSARNEAALDEATRRLVAHLRAHPDVPLADVAHTLQAGRRPWELRRAVVCRDAEEGAALLEGTVPRRLLTGGAAEPAPGAVFLFPGQGSQHPEMAAETYRHEPVFREALDRCAEILRPELGLDLRDVLFPAAGNGGEEEPAPNGTRPAARERLRETALAQPALLAVEYALARLWQSWGLQPEAMLGHSVGEYAAACLAGVFSLEDALALVAARGRLMQSMPSGAMLAVSRSEEEVLPLLREEGDDLSLAAVNGPEAVVVSGPTEAVEALEERLTARRAGTRRLHTSHAFHSATMDAVLEPFAERLREVTLHPPRIPFVSNLTGTWITPEQATDPEYWARQLRGTVRFAEGLGTILETPGRALLEVGPGRALATLARQHPDAATALTVVHSLPHPQAEDSDGPFLLSTLGRLWVAGVEVDWSGYRRGERRRRVPLPAYPFQRRTYWVARTRRPGAARAGVPSIPSGAAVDAAEPSAAEEAGAGGPGSRPEAAPARTTPYEAPRNELERAVAEIWQEVLGTREVSRHDEFFELGGSSLLALRLSARLRERLDVELDPHALLERPTVVGLAEALAEALGDALGEAPGESDREPLDPAGKSDGAAPSREPAPLLVELRAGDPAVPPFVLIHPAGGHAFRFRALGRTLSEAGFEGPVLALRSPGLEPGEEPLDSVPAMARRYLEEIRRSQPGGAESPGADTPGCPGGPGGGPPFRLAGASMGGMIAYEMARLLLEEGETVELLGLLDTFGPGQLPEAFRDAGRRADESAPAVATDSDAPAERLPPEAERARRVAAANTRAMLAYRPPSYPGRVVFFRAAERRPGDPLHPELAWIGPAAAGTQVYVVPGDHESMLEPPHVEALAGHLAGWLLGSGSVTPAPGGADRRRRPTARRDARKTPSPA